MSNSETPAKRLGLESAQRRSEAEDVATRLTALWETLFGPLQDLDTDLKSLKTFFNPVASGARLRRTLSQLPEIERDELRLPEPLAIPVDERRMLVTPEGRVALHLLREGLLRQRDPVVLTDTDVASAERVLLDLYRSWGRHRLSQVLALQAGTHKPLQIPAMGVLLTLLINRATDPSRAIIQPLDERSRRELDGAFFAGATAFAERLLPSSSRDMSKESLHGGWTIGEVKRRIPNAIHDGPPKTNADSPAQAPELYVKPGYEQVAIDLLARELAQRPIDASALAASFDALVDAFRSRAGTLAAYEVAAESPPNTERLKNLLLERFQQMKRDAAASAA